MKKFILIIIFLFTFNISVEARTKYFDYGYLYSNTKYPETAAAGESNIPIENLKNLKQAEVSTYNILGFIEIGNGGIDEAVKKGNITKIHYIDRQVSKAYIPFLFIPIYAKQLKTIIYGE